MSGARVNMQINRGHVNTSLFKVVKGEQHEELKLIQNCLTT